MNSQQPFSYTPVLFNFPLERIKKHEVIVSLGSCFAVDVIGKLFAVGFPGMQNPNGILYHPQAIAEALQHVDFPYDKDDLFFFDNFWHSWQHHGAFSMPTPEEALGKMESTRKNFLKWLKRAGVCFLTLSGAVQFRHIPSNCNVANCHKVPNNEFERVLSSQTACNAALMVACRKIREINPQCKIVFTLSPVRHYPSELPLNAISKARLLESIYHAMEKVPNSAYFPAYEIMMDELRDYRYYADDLLHPSETAQQIVLARLLDSCFEPDAVEYYRYLEQKKRQEAHIPLHPQIPEKTRGGGQPL